MSKITKLCLISLALLVVLFSITAFCLAAGGVRAPKRPFDLAAALASLSPEDRAAVLAKAGIEA